MAARPASSPGLFGKEFVIVNRCTNQYCMPTRAEAAVWATGGMLLALAAIASLTIF